MLSHSPVPLSFADDSGPLVQQPVEAGALLVVVVNYAQSVGDARENTYTQLVSAVNTAMPMMGVGIWCSQLTTALHAGDELLVNVGREYDGDNDGDNDAFQMVCWADAYYGPGISPSRAYGQATTVATTDNPALSIAPAGEVNFGDLVLAAAVSEGPIVALQSAGASETAPLSVSPGVGLGVAFVQSATGLPAFSWTREGVTYARRLPSSYVPPSSGTPIPLSMSNSPEATVYGNGSAAVVALPGPRSFPTMLI